MRAMSGARYARFSLIFDDIASIGEVRLTYVIAEDGLILYSPKFNGLR